MPFKEALWDGSDPSYAPCLQWVSRGGNTPYWVAPKRYVQAGYSVKRVHLGEADKHTPLPPHIASKCRELTREMVRWYDGDDVAGATQGTWKWLIARYQTDPFSGYKGVKANTRRGYDQWLKLVEDVVGHMKIEETRYQDLAMILKGKQEKGRSTHHNHNWFSTLRRVARHGVLIEAPDAMRVSEILSNMRIPTPAARSIAATRNDVAKIVAQADKDNLSTFAVGVLIQFWFGLRAVDVRGQILDHKWADGLTWEMIWPDFKGFTKVISKTTKSMPEPYDFDLTLTPDIRQRLIDLCDGAPLEDRSGPITVSHKTGKPFRPDGWSQAWARCRKRSGVDQEVWLMDTRAGALTDASTIDGVTEIMLRNAGQHKDAATTGRYLRNRSHDANRVVAMRRGVK